MNRISRFLAAAVVAAGAAFASAAQAEPYSVIWGPGADLSVGHISLGDIVPFNARYIYPIVKEKPGGFYSAAEYYSYGSPFGSSANTPDNLEVSNSMHLFLFSDGNELSQFIFFDRPNDGSGGELNGAITSAGLAGRGVYVSVRDDPGDSSYVWNDATGTSNPNWRWSSCCTDGMVLSGLPDASGDNWGLDIDVLSYSGVNTVRIYTLDAAYEDGGRTIQSFQIPISQLNSIVFRRTEAPVVVAVPAPAGMIFPLAALGLVALRRRAGR